MLAKCEWNLVAPHAGAWIEIVSITAILYQSPVAPHAGAWIEIIFGSRTETYRSPSLPMRERGLKWMRSTIFWMVRRVAPHAGAWIEIGC